MVRKGTRREREVGWEKGVDVQSMSSIDLGRVEEEQDRRKEVVVGRWNEGEGKERWRRMMCR